MKKLFKFLERRKVLRNDSRVPLLTENNNYVQAGYGQAVNRYDTPLAENTFNTHEEHRLQSQGEMSSQELVELLNLIPDATFILSEDGSWPNSGQYKLRQYVIGVIQQFVPQHFPKPPTDRDQNLQPHLINVQDAVLHELMRLGPLLESKGLMGCLIECYHSHTFHHLDSLLQDVTSTQNCFVLMNWVRHTYRSEELLGHPELRDMDPIGKINVLFITEWEGKAKDKLLEYVEKDVRRSLEKILQIEISQEHCECEETYVGLNVDVIQCTAAMQNEAQKICPRLSDEVQEVCLQELLIFVKRYMDEQTEALGRKAKMDKPETIHFLKTLKTCKELKEYVQTKGGDVRTALLKEAVETLENLEAFTLKLLMGIVGDIAEHHLKKYFQKDNKRFLLLTEIRKYFPTLWYTLDERKRMMDEAYRLIVRIYIKHLLQTSQRKLEKCWSSDVGQSIEDDARLLHNTISDLAPGVQQWNHMLLDVVEILECKGIDALKMTAASFQDHCLTTSEDMELLLRLLRWKGLSKRDVREVLDALPPSLQPRPAPNRGPRTPWCCCFSMSLG